MICRCGSTKIENSELGLCASCNRLRRKALSSPSVKKPTKINPVSKKKAEALSKKHATQKQMREQGIRWCETCGRSDVLLSHSHIIPVGQYREFEDVAENIIYECWGDSDSCHYIWEHGTLEQRQAQSTWARKIEVIKKLCPKYLELIFLKN
jgi:hypothetical protein